MNDPKLQLWQEFQKHYFQFPSIGLALDLSRMKFPEDFFSSMETANAGSFHRNAGAGKGRHRQPR